MAGDGQILRRAQGPVMVLSLARGPVNALNAALMADLIQALDMAEADPEVSAIVLAAEGAHFCAGLDVAELGRVQIAALPKLTQRIETLTKPLVAALQGNVLGGGLELALACHGRVAHEAARLGLPEISLGLLPVAGSTQRLPRLVGAPVALKLLLEGVPLTAVEALAMGLCDAVVDKNPLGRALTLAAELAAAPVVKTSERRDGMRDAVAYQSAIAETRKRLEGWRLPAPMAAVDCVEAALVLPYDLGLGFEQAQAETLAETAEAAGLRHAFVAEKRAILPPADLAATPAPPLNSLTVLGCAGPVAEVVRMALAAGLRLRLVAPDRASLTDTLHRIAARQEALVAEGRLSADAREADWARLTGALADDPAEPADLVLAAPDAPRLAEMPGPVVALGGRGALILHPAPIAGGLAALAVGPDVPLDLQAAALGLGRRLGWKVMRQGPGAAMDQRLRMILSRAIAVLETEGHARAEIAAVLASYGLGAGTRPKLPAAPDGAAPVLAFCIAALMNEGARILSEGIARRPSDVDAAALLSGLFPRWEGGPMFQAAVIGPMALRADLRARAESQPQIFTPAPLFDRLIAEGLSLADLNRA
ncbi:MAG: enoyl-CoA hydratase/isomerase family protein [Rhodobacteraceae bacterium]|nr:enoyl-CoA hydratase/isomerase family protein [Paracoccaceae bacterium]